MSYSTATLTGTYEMWNGVPAQGTVEIIPNSRVLIDAEGDTILSGRVKETLDETGSFSVTLPSTDDTTVEPATGRQYTVVAKLRHQHLKAVTGIELTGGETVDMADVTSAAETVAEWGISDLQVFRDEAQAAQLAAAASQAAAETAAASVPTDAELLTTFAPNAASHFVDLPAGTIVAHRGNPLNAPEATLDAFRLAVAQGAQVIECDVWATLDGVLFPMHDSTIDRTTNGTGRADAQTSASLRLLSVQGLELNGAPWTNNVPIPTLEDIVREFGNRVALYIQCNGSTGSFDSAWVTAKAMEICNRYGVNPQTVALQTNEASAVPTGQAQGFHMVWGIGSDLAGAIAAGADAIRIPYVGASPTQAELDNAHAAGVKVFGGVTTRGHERDEMRAMGYDFIFSDDATYLNETFVKTADVFAAQMFLPGHRRGNSNAGIFGFDGATGMFGMDNGVGATVEHDLLGYLDLDPNDDGTIVLKVDLRIDAVAGGDTSKNVNFFFGVADKPWNSTSPVTLESSNGYNFACRANGRVEMYKYDYNANVMTQLSASTLPGAALTLGSWITLQFTISPTQLTATRLDAGATTPVVRTDGSFRPLRSMFVGRNGATFRIKNLTTA